MIDMYWSKVYDHLELRMYDIACNKYSPILNHLYSKAYSEYNSDICRSATSSLRPAIGSKVASIPCKVQDYIRNATRSKDKRIIVGNTFNRSCSQMSSCDMQEEVKLARTNTQWGNANAKQFRFQTENPIHRFVITGGSILKKCINFYDELASLHWKIQEFFAEKREDYFNIFVVIPKFRQFYENGTFVLPSMCVQKEN